MLSQKNKLLESVGHWIFDFCQQHAFCSHHLSATSNGEVKKMSAAPSRQPTVFYNCRKMFNKFSNAQMCDAQDSRICTMLTTRTFSNASGWGNACHLNVERLNAVFMHEHDIKAITLLTKLRLNAWHGNKMLYFRYVYTRQATPWNPRNSLISWGELKSDFHCELYNSVWQIVIL